MFLKAELIRRGYKANYPIWKHKQYYG